MAATGGYTLGTAGNNFIEEDRCAFLLLTHAQFSGLQSSETCELSAIDWAKRGKGHTSAVGLATRLVNPIDGEVKSAMFWPS